MSLKDCGGLPNLLDATQAAAHPLHSPLLKLGGWGGGVWVNIKGLMHHSMRSEGNN